MGLSHRLLVSITTIWDDTSIYHESFHGDPFSNKEHNCLITDTPLISIKYYQTFHMIHVIFVMPRFSIGMHLPLISFHHFRSCTTPSLKVFLSLILTIEPTDERRHDKHMCFQAKLPSRTHFMTTMFYYVICNSSRRSKSYA